MNKEELLEKIKTSEDSKEILHLRGQLIKELKKEISTEKDYTKKANLEVLLVNELKKHKNHISKMKEKVKEKKYSIPERVALKVKEIAATIQLFLEKKDILGRLKNGVTSATISSIFAIAMSLGITALTGGTIGLASIATIIPTTSYVALSSLINSLTKETQKSKLLELSEKAPEEVEKTLAFCKEYIIDNQLFIKASINENKIEDLQEKIENEKKLIDEYNRIIANVPSNQLKQVITLELLDIMKKLDYNYEVLENQYLREKIKLTDEEYESFKNDKSKLKKDIVIKSSFIEETVKTTAANIGRRTAITYATRAALSAIFPSLAFNNVKDALTPFIFTLVGNVFESGKVSKSIKMQKTNYTGTIIRMTHPELFEEERNNQLATLQVA